jgi:Leucine-rich repeat (LRR) protein
MLNAFPALRIVNHGGGGSLHTLKTVDVHTFESLPNLTKIDLTINYITSFEYLQIPKNLKELDLSWNKMNYFALSRTMGVLETLNIGANRFRSFKSMDFTFLANLTNLDLSYNPHAYPHEIPGHMKPLVKLRSVDLKSLNISLFDSNFFKNNTKLREINLC